MTLDDGQYRFAVAAGQLSRSGVLVHFNSRRLSARQTDNFLFFWRCFTRGILREQLALSGSARPGQYRSAVVSGEPLGSVKQLIHEAHPTLPRFGTDLVS
jgi:hypothetical protein